MKPALQNPALDPQAFRSINAKYDHLYDFDAAVGTHKERALQGGKVGNQVGKGEDGLDNIAEDVHWSKVRTSIDVLMGVPSANATEGLADKKGKDSVR